MEMELDNITGDIHIIEWRIANFKYCTLNEGERLICPTSKARNFFNTRWALIIYPKGTINPNFLACFLRRSSNKKVGPETLHINVELSLVTFDGVLLFKKQGDKEYERGSSYGFNKYAKLEDIFCRKEILQSSELKLRCKLRLLPPKANLTSHQNFVTEFPTQRAGVSYWYLDNFRSMRKRHPRTKAIEGANGLLSLRAYMDQDKASAEQVQEGAFGREKPKKFLHIVLVKKKTNGRVYVIARVKLLNSKLKIAIEKEFNHTFRKSDRPKEWILPDFIDTNNLSDDCTKNDVLYLGFNFAIFEGKSKTLEIADSTPLKLRKDSKETTLLEDLKDMYESQRFINAVLRVGNRKLLTHKCILAARSPILDEICTLTTKKGTKYVNHEIFDFDDSTIERLLKFIYTDKLEDMNDESCLLLYSAAQKYKISSLHFRCARFLRKCLTVKSFYKALLMAEEYGDSELKMAALDLILKHYNYVIFKDEWQTFTEEHDKLSEEVISHIREKQQQ